MRSNPSFPYQRSFVLASSVSNRLQIFLSFFVLLFLLGCNGNVDRHASETSSNVNQTDVANSGVSVDSAGRAAGANHQPKELIIGLDADMSSGSAKSGEAIRRGVQLAIDQINKQGGLLERPLKLVVRDHRGNPDRGVDNIREFSEMPNLLAVVGGIHTPVALEELPLIHENKIVYLSPWGGRDHHRFQWL